MPLSYMQRLKQVPGVQRGDDRQLVSGNLTGTIAIPRTSSRGSPSNRRNCSRSMASAESRKTRRKAFERERTACVVGRDLANTFGFKVGDKHSHRRRHLSGRFRVHGARHLRQPALPATSCTSTKSTSTNRCPNGGAATVGMFYMLIDDPDALQPHRPRQWTMHLPQFHRADQDGDRSRRSRWDSSACWAT